MKKKLPANRQRTLALSSLALAAAVLGTGRAEAANNPKKPAPKAAAHKPMAHAPAKHPPAKQVAKAPTPAAQNLAQQQAAEQAKKQADANAANAAATAGTPAMARVVTPVTPQDPAKLVGVAQAPAQGDLDKRLVGEWTVTGSTSPLGTLKISGDGQYTWKREDGESAGKLVQVVPRRDAKPGVTYWKLKDGSQEFYAFADPEKKATLAIFAVANNAAAAEATRKGATETTEKPAADSDNTGKPVKS